jgi:glycosyltransferase involved in cell wall biosynthesis
VCEGPPPGLGCVACVRGDASRIERLAAASRFAGGALEGVALRTLVPAAWRGDAHALRERPGAMREALRAAHVVTVPSRFLRDKLVEAGLATPSLVVVRNAVEARRLEGYTRPGRSGPLRVGFVGSLVAHKGLAVLAAAAARLPPGAVRLEVHGDATSQSEFRETAERARAAAQGREIQFHGAFAQAELGRVLSGIDVLAVPSLWYENAPLTILEALALRVPVVASDAGGMRELLAGERGGLLVPMGDAKALAGALARLANEPGLAERLAAAAPEIPGLDIHAREMELRYRQAAGLARGTAPE